MNKGRTKLYIHLGLTVILIAQVLLFVLLKGTVYKGLAVILFLVVLVALMTSYMSIRSVKKTQARVATLPKDYQNFFLMANESILASSMKLTDKRVTVDLILEILEHAHQAGRDLPSVTGNNPSDYVGQFISASGGKLTAMYLFGYSLSSFFFYLLLMKAYKVFRDGHGALTALKSEPLDVGIVLTYFVIAFLFLPWLLITWQKSSQKLQEGLKSLTILLPLSIPLILMAALIFFDIPAWRAFLDTPFPMMSTPWLLILNLLLGASGILIITLSRKAALKKALKDS